MKNLFIIDGAAGTGKTDFFNFIKERYENNQGHAIALPKFSTRMPDADRPIQDELPQDIISVSQDEYNVIAEELRKKGKLYEYRYPFRDGNQYCISKIAIDNALKNNSNVFVIIRSTATIKTICNDYKEYRNVNVVPVLIYSEAEKVKFRLEQEGSTTEQIDKRLSRTNAFLLDYYSLSEKDLFELYKEIVLNNSVKEIFEKQMRAIFEKYDRHEASGSELKAFIIMPMKDDNSDYTQIKNMIKKGAKEAGFDAQRADDLYDNSRNLVMTKVKKAICETDICIVDLSDERPNCYLELGYADAIGKQVFGMIRVGEKLHFDESGYTYYSYKTDEKGLEALKEEISAVLSKWRKRYYL